MRPNMPYDDLFQYLARFLHCDYLSDLQFQDHEAVLRAVQQIPADRFPAWHWIDALCYFSSRHFWSDPAVHVLTAVQARDALLLTLQA